MADKSLGQHWLFDKTALQHIVNSAEIKASEVVLEIGPGLGTLTHELLAAGAKVVAVEFDKSLAGELQDKFAGKDFELRLENILTFDFGSLPKCYKIVANIPYYLTSHLFRIICETTNRPARAVLLVQKEVAERVTATPGEMSLLAVSVQTYGQVSLGEIVPAKLFSPPPKVDSRVLIIDFYDKPLVGDTIQFFRVVKAGFSQPRKKLRSSLAGGLRISPAEADKLLQSADIDPARRAQTLSIEEWQKLCKLIK
ncbi:MAG: 16S rRNA (adenine(1518)-N(6)/adenine(1519)-N(6))-dimethyltransferase RsmA [Patescibacteria group bacterium]